MWKSIGVVCLGASLGALLRWGLCAQFNNHFPPIPPGTLLANLVGAYFVGLAIAVFAYWPGVAPEWRLLIITGFCGGLTTFSAYSGEVVGLLQQGQNLWALGATVAHVVGSVLMTFAGIGTVALVRGAG